MLPSDTAAEDPRERVANTEPSINSISQVGGNSQEGGYAGRGATSLRDAIVEQLAKNGVSFNKSDIYIFTISFTIVQDDTGREDAILPYGFVESFCLPRLEGGGPLAVEGYIP